MYLGAIIYTVYTYIYICIYLFIYLVQSHPEVLAKIEYGNCKRILIVFWTIFDNAISHLLQDYNMYIYTCIYTVCYMRSVQKIVSIMVDSSYPIIFPFVKQNYIPDFHLPTISPLYPDVLVVRSTLSLSIYIYTHIYIYVYYIYTCIHTYIYIDIHIYIDICIYILYVY